MPVRKAKHWCWTLNNYSDEDEKKLSSLPDDAVYIVYGREVGESDTPHLQGYVTWRNRKSLGQTKRSLFQRGHYEICRGTPVENRDYCIKGGDFVEYGELPKGKGHRTDLNSIRDAIKNGKSELEIADDHFTQWVQYRRSFQEYRQLCQPARDPNQIRVFVLEGKTGIGKTRFVHEYAGEVGGGVWSSHDPHLHWFDGYDGQQTALLDDYAGGASYRFLLQLLDRYPLRVPIKGSFVQWNPINIFITTNVRIESWYPDEDIAPLRRRLKWLKFRVAALDIGEWEQTYNEMKTALE